MEAYFGGFASLILTPLILGLGFSSIVFYLLVLISPFFLIFTILEEIESLKSTKIYNYIFDFEREIFLSIFFGIFFGFYLNNKFDFTWKFLSNFVLDFLNNLF